MKFIECFDEFVGQKVTINMGEFIGLLLVILLETAALVAGGIR